MKAVFHTNLDLASRFVSDKFGWGTKYDARDFQLGDIVVIEVFVGSGHKTAGFELEVVARRHKFEAGTMSTDAYTEIELHMRRSDTRSIREWSEWFERHVLGRDV